MANPEICIDNRVYVGGCVGVIENITDNLIKVTGTYHYVEGDADPWRFFYDRDTFENVACWDDKRNQWNISSIEPKGI